MSSVDEDDTSSKRYYITTAIDYPNAPPHIGHALEKVAADVAAATTVCKDTIRTSAEVLTRTVNTSSKPR